MPSRGMSLDGDGGAPLCSTAGGSPREPTCKETRMKSATKMMLTTLVVAAAGALSAMPAQADGHHTEQLNA